MNKTCRKEQSSDLGRWGRKARSEQRHESGSVPGLFRKERGVCQVGPKMSKG